LKSIKGQIVVDFEANHSNIESLECYIGIKPWVLHFDGSKHVNSVGIGVILISPNNTLVKMFFKIQPLCSNNEVEHEALIVGLETLFNLGARHVLIKEDFELVINQLTHKFKCIKSNLLKYFSYASKLLTRFDKVKFEHVFREQNKEANDLAQITSSYKLSKQNFETLINIKEKLQEIEFFNIDVLTTHDWRKPLVDYL